MSQSGGRTRTQRLVLGSALGLVVVALYLSTGRPMGIPGQWVWMRNALPPRLLPALPGLAVFAAVAVLASRLRWDDVPPGRRALWLALIVLAVFALQVGLLNSAGEPWVFPGAVIISPSATTYFSTSYDIQGGVRAWVSSYQDRMPTQQYHVRTHPPGLVLFFYALRGVAAHLVPARGTWFDGVAETYRIFGLGPTPADAAAAIGGAFLLALIGALGLIPLYALSIRLLRSQAALAATLLAGSIPALLLFAASPDQLIFTLTLTTLALSYVAWRDERPWPAFFAGVVFAVASFLSFGVLAAAGWLVLLVVVGTLRRPDRVGTVRMFVPLGLAGVAGFALVYVLLVACLGYHPLAVAREALFAHRGVTTVEQSRSYLAWLLLNPVDFLLFAGLPLAVAAGWALRETRGRAELRCWRTFLMASALTFVALDLSGTVRAEVGRIWLFLMGPLAMAAGPAFEEPERAGAWRYVLAFQVLTAVVLKVRLSQYVVL